MIRDLGDHGDVAGTRSVDGAGDERGEGHHVGPDPVGAHGLDDLEGWRAEEEHGGEAQEKIGDQR